MLAIDPTLLALLAILSIGLVLPEIFRRKKFPFSIFLLIAGAILGPTGFHLVKMNTTIDFFGFLGSTFLMFMAGLEVKLEYIKTSDQIADLLTKPLDVRTFLRLREFIVQPV